MPTVEGKNEQREPAQGHANRRQKLVLGAAAAAACAAGLAWRHLSSPSRPPDSSAQSLNPSNSGQARPKATSKPDLESLLWQREWSSPSGKAVQPAALRGGALLLNFWATWCPPCLNEMPLLESFYKQNAAKNWQLIGFAADKAEAVVKFLASRPVSYPIALAGLQGLELGQQLGNTVGGLPYSLWIDSKGQLRDQHLGELSQSILDNWATASSR